MRLTLLLSALLLAGCTRSDDPKPIELGHLHPGIADDPSVRALDLALEDVNKDPPLGRPVHLRHAPGGTTPAEFGAQAVRLVVLNKVAGIVGGVQADDALRIGTVLQGQQVVVLSPAGGGRAAGGPNAFTVGVAPDERGRVLAKAVLDPKPQAVAVVRDPMAKSAGQAADRFVADCKAAGVRVVDPAPASLKLDAEVLFFACPARQALEAKPAANTRRVFGGDDSDLPALLGGGAGADGFVVATAATPDAPAERLTAFSKRFQEKHGQPPTTAAILAHDALTIWVEAVRRANSLDALAVRDQLLKSDKPFDALTGPLTFAPDHTARRPVYAARVADGGLKDVRAFDAGK